MVPLARRTLLYEWRRFLPSTLAVAFSGLGGVRSSSRRAAIRDRVN